MGSIIKNSLFERKAFIIQPHFKFKTPSIFFKIAHYLDDEISLSLILILQELTIPYKRHIKLTDLLMRHLVLRELIILYKRPIKRLKSSINFVQSTLFPFKIFHLFLSIKWKAWGSNYYPFIARIVM